jgi:hypothetical protein
MAGKKRRSDRGGARPGAGRPRVEPEVSIQEGKDFATRVLFRVGRTDWLTYADVSEVSNDEELALHLLANQTTRKKTFQKLLDRKYGRRPS